MGVAITFKVEMRNNKSAQSIKQDGAFSDLTRQVKYMLRDSFPSEELGRLVGEVVAVVVQQVIPVRWCSIVNLIFKTQQFDSVQFGFLSRPPP